MYFILSRLLLKKKGLRMKKVNGNVPLYIQFASKFHRFYLAIDRASRSALRRHALTYEEVKRSKSAPVGLVSSTAYPCDESEKTLSFGRGRIERYWILALDTKVISKVKSPTTNKKYARYSPDPVVRFLDHPIRPLESG